MWTEDMQTLLTLTDIVYLIVPFYLLSTKVGVHVTGSVLRGWSHKMVT